MRNYNTTYQKYIKARVKIPPSKIQRGNFYLLKSYKNVDGIKTNYKESEAPIIFVLYVSKRNDEIHAIKLSDVKLNDIKKLFTKLVSKESGEIVLEGQSKKIYESVLKKIPNVTNETYRTYKWSGIESIFILDTEEEKLHEKIKK